MRSPLGLESAEAPDQPGPALRRDEVADGSRAAVDLFQQVAVRGGQVLGRRAGPPLRDEVEPLEQARRKHRPDDDRGWSEVVGGDPAGEVEGERRQERSVGPDPCGDRFEGDPLRCARLAEDDPERLAPAELDEDRLARHEVGEAGRDGVRVGPRAAATRGVDRDLDRAHPGRIGHVGIDARRGAGHQFSLLDRHPTDCGRAAGSRVRRGRGGSGAGGARRR